MRDYFRTQAIGENKRARTRGLLIDAAVGVFAEKGIEAASVNEVTAIAGLANGTFYNHFRDKDELARCAAEAIVLEIGKRMAEQMADLDEGVQRVTVASWAFARLVVARGDWARVLLAEYQRRPVVGTSVFRYLRADLELAEAQSGIDVEVDDYLLEQLVALIMAALRRQLEHGESEAMMRRMCESMLRVIGLTAAQARREVALAERHPLVAQGQGWDDPGRFLDVQVASGSRR
jgi:AcrR family transcriptional regulator